MKKILFTFALTVLVIMGCEEKDDDKVNQAQKCLNDARLPSDAAGCKALIEGIQSEKANQVRCALVVLENGVTQQIIIDAFKALDTGSEDPVVEIATKIGLGDLSDPADGIINNDEILIAQTIKDVCYQTTSIGMKTVAQLILFGTQAKSLATVDFNDPSDIANNICTMPAADAGTFANDVFDLYCVPTFSNEKICKTLQDAGAGTSDATTVGESLMDELHGSACP